VSHLQGIKSAGRKGSRLMAAGAFDARRHPPGTRVQFTNGQIYRIGYRELAKGSTFRTVWVGHELRRETADESTPLNAG
jgi:hypothetical protein